MPRRDRLKLPSVLPILGRACFVPKKHEADKVDSAAGMARHFLLT
jgi:hypothetical protein